MKFQPSPLWHGGHRQTVAGFVLRRAPKLPWQRVYLASAHGDALSLDILSCSQAPQSRLLLLHGLTGNSQASPIPQIARYASQHGIETWALNFRGADGQTPEIPRLYHAGCSDDLAAIVSQLPQDLPWTMLGFSLGANVLLKWLGEQKVEGVRAMAVSCPFDLAQCAQYLEKDPITRLYRRVLMRNLKAMASSFIKHHPEYQPGLPIKKWCSFYDIDQYLTAPLHGFEDAQDYWNRCSSVSFLEEIVSETLILHAQDDPFQPTPPIQTINPYLRWELPVTGGHVGFLGGFRDDWLVRRAVEFASGA